MYCRCNVFVPFGTVALLLFLTPLGALSAGNIMINELHYDPDVESEDVEFVELYNVGTNLVDMSGWMLTDAVEFTFPPGTSIPAGGYLVAAQDPPEFQAKFGFLPHGPWVGRLDNLQDDVELRDATGDRVDRVSYQIGFPWPIVGDAPGYSIELVHPDLDNDLGSSWRASVVGGVVNPSGDTLVPRSTSWKYFKGTQEASSPDNTAWRGVGFNDAGWLDGVSPIFYETGSGYSGGTDLTGDMPGNYSSVYMRKVFNVADPSLIGRVEVALEADDGAIVWINGVEVARLGMAGGFIPHTGTALDSSGSPDSKQSTESIPNTSGLLQAGDNVLAVHALNAQLSGSSDFLIAAVLSSFEGGSGGAGPTPGAQNAVFAANIPPQVRQVDHSPKQPAGGDPVRITAKVTDPDGVSSVVLEYQVVMPGSYIERTDPAYESSWTTVAMNDTGVDGDVAAGDDTYSATLPGSVQVHRRLIRYRIRSIDGGARTIQAPYEDDPAPNFAYFVYDGVPAWQGSIRPGVEPIQTFQAEEMSRLPVYHLVSKRSEVENCTWFSRYGGDEYQWTGTLVYDGEVYDHIHFRARGGVWRYSMVKNMWKFLLNRGHYFQARDNWGRKYKNKWRRLNLGASIQQGDFNHRGEQGMFESVGFRLFNLAGVAAPHSSYITLRIVDEAAESFPGNQFEGDFWGVYMALEQLDGRFLDEHGLPSGNLYKMENGTGAGNGQLKNQGADQVGDNSDLTGFRNTASSNPTDQWWRDNFDLDGYYNYYSMVQAIHHYDICCGKNYYWYFNPETGKMSVLPWDFDLTWADNMYEANDGGTDYIYDTGQIFSRPAFRVELGNRVRELLDLLYNEDQGYRVIEEHGGLLQGNAPLSILEADRAMWDYNPKMVSGTYTPNLGKAGQGRFYTFPGESGTNATLRGSFNATVELMKFYVSRRANNTSYPSGTPLRVWATDAQIPSTPLVSSIGPAEFPLNELSFEVSNYAGNSAFAALKWRIAEVTPAGAPAFDPTRPNHYEIEANWESLEITDAGSRQVLIPPNAVREGSTYRVRARYKDITGRWGHWSAPVEFVAGAPAAAALMLANLRVTEVMYHAPRGVEYDYVELHNTSPDTAIDLGGAKFTQGIDFFFHPGTLLEPGQYIVVHGHPNELEFRMHYGLPLEVSVAGPYEGNLSNSGEPVVLRTSAGGRDIAAFEYSDRRGWPNAADGAGHSLVPLIMSQQVDGALNYAGNWRASTHINGSPGAADPDSTDVLRINEVAAHTDFPLPPPEDSNDWIELKNTGASDFTFGTDWYLSDAGTFTNLNKWMIPAGTMIPAGGYVSFDEQTGFHNPANIGFGLNKAGEQVYLSHLPGTAEDRVVDSVRFKGQESEWTLVRHPDAGPYWHAVGTSTRDAPNASPLPHLVVSELMYHPPDLPGGVDNSDDEFIEVFNPTGGAVALFDTNGTWRLDGGVSFDFPGGVTLDSMSYLLVVNFNPADSGRLNTFRSKYGIADAGLPIFGPYGGQLANRTERVALEKPQAPDVPEDSVSWVIVDEVIYADRAPWPQAADGIGPSLQRLAFMEHGSNPSNWAAAAPSPGVPYIGGVPPTITVQPTPPSQVSGAGSMVSYSVAATGTPPLSYQWLKDGSSVPDATSGTFTIDFTLPQDTGIYQAVVLNAAGSAVSEPVLLNVTTPPRILTQPNGATVHPGSDVTFTVSASGTGVLTYSWRRNNTILPGENGETLTLTDVRPEDAGSYYVTVMDDNGITVSIPAMLRVLVRPVVIDPAVNVTNAVPQGGSITLSVTVSNTTTLPIYCKWRFGFSTLTNLVIEDDYTTHLTLNDIQPSMVGNYTVVVTNEAFFLPGVLSPVMRVNVLTDGDGDGMDDQWELDHGLNPGVAEDADMDADSDGMSNREEYQAGTDPNDENSFLKIESIETDFVSTGTVRLTFPAAAHRTYSLEFKDALGAGPWSKIKDVFSAPTNRLVELIDAPSAQIERRYYRLVTPRSVTP